jgi:hypothetical protein
MGFVRQPRRNPASVKVICHQRLSCAKETSRLQLLLSAVNVPWYLLPFRTDSVNRGICISSSTLAIVVLLLSIKFSSSSSQNNDTDRA